MTTRILVQDYDELNELLHILSDPINTAWAIDTETNGLRPIKILKKTKKT
jgi:hypothetical protein